MSAATELARTVRTAELETLPGTMGRVSINPALLLKVIEEAEGSELVLGLYRVAFDLMRTTAWRLALLTVLYKRAAELALHEAALDLGALQRAYLAGVSDGQRPRNP